jgi:hypothetical protein
MSEVIGKAPGSMPAIAQDDPDGHITATRRLLRRLRGIMAASGSAQERLDRWPWPTPNRIPISPIARKPERRSITR